MICRIVGSGRPPEQQRFVRVRCGRSRLGILGVRHFVVHFWLLLLSAATCLPSAQPPMSCANVVLWERCQAAAPALLLRPCVRISAIAAQLRRRLDKEGVEERSRFWKTWFEDRKSKQLEVFAWGFSAAELEQRTWCRYAFLKSVPLGAIPRSDMNK